MEVPARQFYHPGSGAIVSISEPHVAKFLSAIGVKLVELGIPEGPMPGDDWLTVSEAAELLGHDLGRLGDGEQADWRTLNTLRSRVSCAASDGKFKAIGTGTGRRIDPDSFAAYRLRLRDRALDREDGEGDR